MLTLAWLMLGIIGFTFSTGLGAVWTAVGSAVGAVLAWVILAKRFMKESKETGTLTLTTLIAANFNKNQKMIIYSTSFIIIIFFVLYIGGQIAGAGKTLYQILGTNSLLAMILCTVLIIILAFWGGFTSVVWTDMIQGVTMLIALTVIPILAFIKIYNNDLSISDTLTTYGGGMDSWTGGLTGAALGALLVNNFSNFFGYFGGQPQLSSRFMALKDKREARIGTITVIIWAVVSFVGAFLVVLTSLTIYSETGIADPDTAMLIMIMDLAPPWLAGVFIGGIIAAIVTTADSQLLVVVSSVNEDIIHNGMGLTLTDKQLMRISRALVIIVGLAGFVFALTSESIIFDIVNWAWAGVGSTLSAVILLIFFWRKRFSSIGAVVAIIGGFIFTLFWFPSPLEEVLSARVLTFFVAGFFAIVFSLLFPDKETDN